MRSLATFGSLVGLGDYEVDTKFGPFQAHLFHDFGTRTPMLVLTRGDASAPAPLLARVHSSCVTSEVLLGCDCDCAHQLEAALEEIAREGRGALFYLMQEGRGSGMIAKARDRMLVQASRHRLSTFDAYAELGLEADSRSYGAVASAIRLLGLRGALLLLTNNPEKRLQLERHKVSVAGTRAVRREASPFNVHYLDAKKRSGHTLERSRAEHAELPERVERVEPTPLVEVPSLVSVASYLLPVALRAGDPHPLWFRLHVYLDLARREERIVLSLGGAAPRLVRVQSDALLDRLPLRQSPARRDWSRTLRALAARGAGCAFFAPLSLGRSLGHGGPEPEVTGIDDTLGTLVAHHLGGESVELLLGAGECPGGRLLEVLDSAGVDVRGETRL